MQQLPTEAQVPKRLPTKMLRKCSIGQLLDLEDHRAHEHIEDTVVSCNCETSLTVFIPVSKMHFFSCTRTSTNTPWSTAQS